VEDSPYTGGAIGLATELRNREKVLGTTIDSCCDLRIRDTEPASPPAGRAGGGRDLDLCHQPALNSV